MKTKNKKYSDLIRPLQILVDLLILNFSISFLDIEYFNIKFISYITISWLIISFFTGFYNVFRYTSFLKLIKLLLSHFSLFILFFFSYFTIFKEGEIVSNQSNFLLSCVFLLSFFKFFFFFLLKNYRLKGKIYRNVIFFGCSKSAKNISLLFNERKDFGYRFLGFYSDKQSNSNQFLGSIKYGLTVIKKGNIDEVYCEMNSIKSSKLKEIRTICNINNINFNLLPENKAIYSKNFTMDYYGVVPVLKPKKLPFERIENLIIKRVFDLIFSLFICVFLLSWFLPILWLIVKIDSKGPFFFVQNRDGINGNQFYCYKIRSMKVNKEADLVPAIKDDERVTKIGAFLRKTSLDELPQFINVLLGDMSVVGPRPHINIQTEQYVKEVNNYLVRNSVKPGITGLAQVSGYRGIIEKKTDIENRVRLDIFYIENWSFLLDVKVILQTFTSIFKSSEKAY